MSRQRAHAKRYTGPDVVLLRSEPTPSVEAVYKPGRREGSTPSLVVLACPFCKHRHIYPTAPGERETVTRAKCNPGRMYRLTAGAA